MAKSVPEALLELQTAVAHEEAERKRLADWDERNVQNHIHHEVRKYHDETLKLAEENARLRNELYYTRQNLRRCEALKGRTKVSHLPTPNSIHRVRWIAEGVGVAERIFLRHWRKENKRVPGTNSGAGCLELLMSPDSNNYAASLTQRDATVAATVIQWLGTNCGRCFLEQCERDVKKAVELYHERNRKRINRVP